jgi:diguanylate cyclase (GGDEF)-like protein
MDEKTARKYILDITPDITREFAELKFKEINILLKANMIANLNMRFKVSLHVLCDLISEMIQFDSAVLYLRDNDLNLLSPIVVRGFPRGLPKPYAQGNLFAEWCQRFGKTFFIPFSTDPEVSCILGHADSKSLIAVPIDESNQIIGTIQLFSKEAGFFTQEDAKLLWLLMIQSEVLFRHFDDPDALEQTARPSASLSPSRLVQLHEQMAREIGRAQRRKTPVSLLLIEIDQWDDYRERYGHLRGEETFNELSAILTDEIRQIDTICRYTENRFALILAETDRKGGTVFAERLRETLNRRLFPDNTGERTVGLTLSAGLVTFPFDGKDKFALLQAGEEALHRARDAGGDRISKFPERVAEAVETDGNSRHLDLSRVTQAIHSVFNVERLLELVVEISMEALGAEKGSLLLAEEDTDEFTIKVACGFGKYAELIRNTRVSGDKTVTGWVASLQKPVVSGDIDDIQAVRKNLYKDYRNNSFLSIPIMDTTRTRGVLHLSNKAGGSIFTEEDLGRMLPLTEHLSAFLQDGFQFEKTQHSFSKKALSALAKMMESKDPYCANHSTQVAYYAKHLGQRMQMAEQDVEKLALSARLHDIGKIAIRCELFHKPARLNDEEIAIVRRHPFFSWKILDALSAEEDDVKNTILQHHERLNGSGYPYGLIGEQIPLPSRILSVADAYVSLTSERPHRPAFTKNDALKEMHREGGEHYDAQVLQRLSELVQ